MQTLQLIHAAYDGRVDEVCALIARGVEINVADEYGFTALRWACDGGCINVVQRLLIAGAEVDKVDLWDNTPLHIASLNGYISIASLLLAAGAEVNKASKYGETPLLYACYYGNLDLVKLLSSYGATRTWANGRTAEVVASQWRQTDIQYWLVLSRHWTTPLHHLKVIDAARTRTLLDAGADVYAASPDFPNAPTPRSLANALRDAGTAPIGSPAHLVLQASYARVWMLALVIFAIHSQLFVMSRCVDHVLASCGIALPDTTDFKLSRMF